MIPLSYNDHKMNIKATRHTSTDLEQISDKIEQILKDNSAVFDNALVDVDSMTPKELKAFAERGSWNELRFNESVVVVVAHWGCYRWFGSMCVKSRCACRDLRGSNVSFW